MADIIDHFSRSFSQSEQVSTLILEAYISINVDTEGMSCCSGPDKWHVFHVLFIEGFSGGLANLTQFFSLWFTAMVELRRTPFSRVHSIELIYWTVNIRYFWIPSSNFQNPKLWK